MKTDYNITNDGENITYLDINIINDSQKRIPATFSINRSAPIIHEIENYMASVIRFTVPLTSQPLFLWFNDVNKISITYNNVRSTKSLIYQQTEFNLDNQITSSGVGGAIYNYQTMANMMNIAIKSACVDLGLTSYPYMTFNPDTSRFKIYMPIFWIDIYPYTDTTKPKLFFNKLLQTYFINFNNISYNNNVNNNECDYLIICSNNNNNYYKDLNNNEWFYNEQEWNGVQYMNSLSNISIVSNLFPSAGDNLNNATFQKTGFQSGSVKVITDFEVNKEETGSQRSLVQYQSQNYRYIDLSGQKGVYNLDFQFFVYYQELLNGGFNVSPYQTLFLNPYEVITLKIMFKRKNLNY